MSQPCYRCPKCGAQISFGVRFCSYCGVQLDWTSSQLQSSYYQQQNDDEQKTPSTGYKSPLVIGLIVILFVFIFGIGGVITYNKFTENVMTTTPASIITSIPPTSQLPNQPSTQPPAQTATSTQLEESYQYDNYYPIILSFSDNKGNVVKSSQYNKYSGPYSSTQTGTVLHIGDKIQCEIVAVDPEERPILCNFNSNSKRFNELIGIEAGSYKWITSNKITYEISEEDLKSAGETLRIVGDIKTEKENLRFPQGPYDDVIYLDYKLSP